MGTRVDNLETQIYELQKQNNRLQSELDKQIKDNRKLIKALKEYANKDNWCYTEDDYQLVFVNGENDNGFEIARDVLKEIEED